MTPYRPWARGEWPEHRLLAEYLGGSAGLVFQEIREARGFAYSASGGYFGGRDLDDQGYLWGTLACQPDKAAEAASILISLLSPPAGLSTDSARFRRTKTAAIEKLAMERIGFRSRGPTAEAWRRRGITGDPRPELLQELRGRTVADVAAFSSSMQERPFTLIVAGDVSRIDRKTLATLAPIEKMGLAELVAY